MGSTLRHNSVKESILQSGFCWAPGFAFAFASASRILPGSRLCLSPLPLHPGFCRGPGFAFAFASASRILLSLRQRDSLSEIETVSHTKIFSQTERGVHQPPW